MVSTLACHASNASSILAWTVRQLILSIYSPTQFIMSKRIGVVGVTKAENAQLGLLLKYIFTNDEVYNSLPSDVLVYPDAFTQLCGRYSNAV